MTNPSETKQSPVDRAAILECIDYKSLTEDTVLSASKKFGLAEAAARRHYKKLVPDEEVPTAGRQPSLPADVQAELAMTARMASSNGFALTKEELKDLIVRYVRDNAGADTPVGNYIRQYCRFLDGEPSDNWLTMFASTHHLPMRKNNSRRSRSVAPASDPFIIYAFFDSLEEHLDKLDLREASTHIFNVDEAAFFIDHRGNVVVADAGSQAQQYIPEASCNCLTVLACVSADGCYLPPLVVFRGNDLQPDCQDQESIKGTRYAMSEDGWMTTDAFQSWFEEVFMERVTQRPVLLIFNGDMGHIGLDVIRTASDNGVYILRLPPGTGERLQPLEVGCYTALREQWARRCAMLMRDCDIRSLSRMDLVDLFFTAWKSSMTEINIQTGFRNTGVYPCDRHRYPVSTLDPLRLATYRHQSDEMMPEIGFSQLAGIVASRERHEEQVYIGRSPTKRSTVVKDEPTVKRMKLSSKPSLSAAKKRLTPASSSKIKPKLSISRQLKKLPSKVKPSMLSKAKSSLSKKALLMSKNKKQKPSLSKTPVKKSSKAIPPKKKPTVVSQVKSNPLPPPPPQPRERVTRSNPPEVNKPITDVDSSIPAKRPIKRSVKVLEAMQSLVKRSFADEVSITIDNVLKKTPVKRAEPLKESVKQKKPVKRSATIKEALEDDDGKKPVKRSATFKESVVTDQTKKPVKRTIEVKEQEVKPTRKPPAKRTIEVPQPEVDHSKKSVRRNMKESVIETGRKPPAKRTIEVSEQPDVNISTKKSDNIKKAIKRGGVPVKESEEQGKKPLRKSGIMKESVPETPSNKKSSNKELPAVPSKTPAKTTPQSSKVESPVSPFVPGPSMNKLIFDEDSYVLLQVVENDERRGRRIVYYVGSILSKTEVGWKIQCLRRYGGLVNCFMYLPQDDIFDYPESAIVRVLGCPTICGSVYNFPDDLSAFERVLL